MNYLQDSPTFRPRPHRVTSRRKSTHTPTPADRIQIGATIYAILRAEPYAPGGEPLYFDLILRA